MADNKQFMVTFTHFIMVCQTSQKRKCNLGFTGTESRIFMAAWNEIQLLRFGTTFIVEFLERLLTSFVDLLDSNSATSG